MKWEFGVRLRSKIFLISLFMPLLIISISIIPSLLMDKGSDETISLGIVEQTQLISEGFELNLQDKYHTLSGESKYWVTNFNLLNNAKTALQEKSIDAIMIIPKDILDSSKATYYAKSISNFNIIKELNQTLTETVISKRIADKGVDAELVHTIGRPVNMALFEVSKEGEVTEGNEMMVLLGPFFFVFLLAMAVFINGQLLLRSVMEERTNRMVEILLSAVSPKEIMVGKILGLGSLGLVQITVYVLMGIVFGLYKGVDVVRLDELPILFAYFITGYFFFASIYATVGTLFDTEQDAQQSMSIISIIAMIPVIGSFYFMANPNAAITKALSFFPPMTPFMMILRIGIDAAETWEIFLTLLMMIIFIWIMMNMAGKIFKTALLMYGKRVTFPEIWRWINA